MISYKIKKLVFNLFFFLLLSGCSRDKNILPSPKPKPLPNPTVFSSLKDLISSDDFISDSIWKDSITHTVYVKTGPRFMLHSFYREKIFPGAILNKYRLWPLGDEIYNFETLPVTLNFSNNSSINFNPSYNNFISELESYRLKNTKPFENMSSDNGRPFSTYNDLVLINGYKNEPVTNWLKIINKRPTVRISGIVYTFKTVDFGVSVNLPRMGELIDKSKFKSQIEADTLGYINQINIGKRAIVSFMCDTTFEAARIIIKKVKNKEILNDSERQIIKNGEVGYFLQGFGQVLISSTENEEIIKGLYSIISNSSSTVGEPIEFFVRNIKDFAPYVKEIKFEVIRK